MRLATVRTPDYHHYGHPTTRELENRATHRSRQQTTTPKRHATHPGIGSRDQQAVAPHHEHAVVSDVKHMVQVADHLLQLVLVVLPVHVLLGGQERRDALSNYHVELATLVLVPHENHVQEVALVVAQQVIHDLTTVLVDIHQQS